MDQAVRVALALVVVLVALALAAAVDRAAEQGLAHPTGAMVLAAAMVAVGMVAAAAILLA